MSPDESIGVTLEDLVDEVGRGREARVETVSAEVLRYDRRGRRGGRVLREGHDVYLHALAVFDPEAFTVASVAFAHHQISGLVRVVLAGVVRLEQVGDFVVVLLHGRVVRPRELLHDLTATETELDDFITG